MKLSFCELHEELCLLMSADQFYALPVDAPEAEYQSLLPKAEPWRYPLCRQLWLLAARRAVARLSAWLGDVVWLRDGVEAAWLLPDALVERLNLDGRVAAAVSEAVRQRIRGFDVAPDLGDVVASLVLASR